MTGPGTIWGGGCDGKEVWETATMAEEDSIMAEAVKLMKLHNVPSDFRQFASDCCHFGGGAVDEWEMELDVRKWSLELLKAAIADGSVNSGEWDSLPYSAVLPVPMPTFMLKNALAYELEVAVGESGGDSTLKLEEATASKQLEEEVERVGGEEVEEVCGEERYGIGECGKGVEENVVGREERMGRKESVVKEESCGEKVQVGEDGKERVREAALPSSWGTLLPASASTPLISNLSPIWRPWEIEESTKAGRLPGPRRPGLGMGRRKRRSPAAEARSRRRLHDWQQRVDLQRGFNRLHSEQQNTCTPLPAPKEIRSVRLLERLEGVQGKEPGSQAPPSNQCNFGGERREFPGSGCNGQGLFASGFQHFSSLLQIPTTISAESSFPTPPPPPSWSHKWSGDWWLVPAGMSTQCASCQLWGPLTPGG